MEEGNLLAERRGKVFSYLKSNYEWLTYLCLAIITYLAVKIRTNNLAGLKDITTNDWTLGPDLDPFLFLRWAKEIVANGSLAAIDFMRSAPLGFETKQELLLHPYLIVWFHKLASIFGSDSVTHSAVLFPAFMFGLTVIAFFFFVRKAFAKNLGNKKASVIALIASFFLSVVPSLVPRTIAGIPEKESAAFLFLFLGFYFFISAWQAKSAKGRISLAIAAGIASAMMSLIWGGYIFLFLTISLSTFFAFIFYQVDKSKFSVYITWLLTAFIIMPLVSSRYYPINLIVSIITGIAIVVAFILILHMILFKTRIRNYLERGKIARIPKPVISIIIGIILIIIITSLLFGPGFLFSRGNDVVRNLVSPISSRHAVTVAENRQPFFDEWARNFGPLLSNFPIFFWLFFVGSIYLFRNAFKNFSRKVRNILAFAYTILISGIVFSRYSGASALNGDTAISFFVYFGSILFFLICLGYYYNKNSKQGEEYKFRNIPFEYILIIAFFFFTLIAARGAVRTIMMLVPSTSIIVGYLVVGSFSGTKKMTGDLSKKIAWIFVFLIIIGSLFSGYAFYNASSQTSKSFVPAVYNQQWQKAMSWVRENTQEDAIFGHWWDYGYWVQSIGERATILDGGNSINYWNHLMGRHGLTGPNNNDALEFLFSHKTTHFLIDSTDIGKYTAFSSIGSDADFDRLSWLPTFLKNDQQTSETKDTITHLYSGGTALDMDIIYDLNGSTIFLPSGRAAVAGFSVEKDRNEEIVGVNGIFSYQGQFITIPLRYGFSDKFYDFGEGLEAGVFLFDSLSTEGNQGVTINKEGAGMFLSERTVKSQLARLYLYGEENGFKLVHSETDIVVEDLRRQNQVITDIIFYNGIRGPIKIWELDYPIGIRENPEYLEKGFPDPALTKAK